MSNGMYEIVDSITKIIGAGAALIGLPLVGWQVRQARASVAHIEKARIADLKPYVSVSLKRADARGEDSVLLLLTNFGRTPALNVKITFPEQRAWNYVSNPNFAFADENGITVLAPGETKSYFLGRLVPGSGFARVLVEDLLATVTFGSQVSESSEQHSVRVGLNDHRFGVNQ